MSETDPFVGKLFGGRWLIERPLSSGGMGAIYVATHSETGRPVALKVIQSQAARSDEFVARFKRETGALARVSHPNVVTFLDSGAQDGTLYLVMELLEGKSLRSIMGAPLSWQRAFAIAADVCKALAAVHKIGIVHRDLKPENIFLQEAEGHDELAKLIDFGIVRLHDHASATMATSTGNVVGTPGYISPEQLQGHPASATSDVYAVGVILYELITGKFPFAAPTPHAMLVKQLIDPLPPPRSALPSVPKHVEDTILRFIERDSQLRIQSAREGLTVLTDALKRADLAPDQATEYGGDIGAVAQEVIARHTPSGAPVPSTTPAKTATPAPPAAQAGVSPHVPPQPVPTSPTGIHPVQLPTPMPAKQMSPGNKFALVAGLVFLAFCVCCGMCSVVLIAADHNDAQEDARELERAARDAERTAQEIEVDAEALAKGIEAGAQAFAKQMEAEAKRNELKKGDSKQGDLKNATNDDPKQVEPNTKGDKKDATIKSESRVTAKVDLKGDAKSDAKSGARTDAKSGAKPDDDDDAFPGRPTRKEVRAFVNARLPEIATCWNISVAELKESLIEGDEHVTVMPDGSVRMHSLVASQASTFPQIECAVRRVSKWKMTPFKGPPKGVKLRDDDNKR